MYAVLKHRLPKLCEYNYKYMYVRIYKNLLKFLTMKSTKVQTLGADHAIEHLA